MISADNDWQSVDDRAGVAIYCRSRVGSRIKEFKGTGLIDAPPARVEQVLQDVRSYAGFMPYVKEARTLSVNGAQALAYQQLSIPLLSDRDYTVKVEHGTLTGPLGVTFRDTWQTANDLGPAEIPGVVRVKVDEGSWLLEPTGPQGASTQATYQIYTDSGGAVPAFMANHASEMAIPKIFEAIRKQVQDPKYQK